MRNLLGTAVAAVGLSMVLLPNCCSTANAGMSVSVSVGVPVAYEYYPAEYSTNCGYVVSDDEEMNWDNVIVLNENLIGFWVLLPGSHWVLRCRSMWFNSGCDEWCFGPWWNDYSISYDCHCNGPYYNRYCPIHGERFHYYMNLHYRNWHSRYFTCTHNRYQPRVERQVIISHERIDRDRAPVIIHRQPSVPVERVQQCRPVTDERTIIINHESKQPVKIDGGNRTERIDNNNKGNCRQLKPHKTGQKRSTTAIKAIITSLKLHGRGQ